MKEFKNLLVLCAFVFVNIFALSAATEVATIAEAKEMASGSTIIFTGELTLQYVSLSGSDYYAFDKNNDFVRLRCYNWVALTENMPLINGDKIKIPSEVTCVNDESNCFTFDITTKTVKTITLDGSGTTQKPIKVTIKDLKDDVNKIYSAKFIELQNVKVEFVIDFNISQFPITKIVDGEDSMDFSMDLVETNFPSIADVSGFVCYENGNPKLFIPQIDGYVTASAYDNIAGLKMLNEKEEYDSIGFRANALVTYVKEVADNVIYTIQKDDVTGMPSAMQLVVDKSSDLVFQVGDSVMFDVEGTYHVSSYETGVLVKMKSAKFIVETINEVKVVSSGHSVDVISFDDLLTDNGWLKYDNCLVATAKGDVIVDDKFTSIGCIGLKLRNEVASRYDTVAVVSNHVELDDLKTAIICGFACEYEVNGVSYAVLYPRDKNDFLLELLEFDNIAAMKKAGKSPSRAVSYQINSAMAITGFASEEFEDTKTTFYRIFVQDSTGALQLNHQSATLAKNYKVGDVITGISGNYLPGGKTYIDDTIVYFASAPSFDIKVESVEKATESYVAQPIEVTLEQLDDSYASQLVVIKNVTYKKENSVNLNGDELTKPMIYQNENWAIVSDEYQYNTDITSITGVYYLYGVMTKIIPRSQQDIVSPNPVDVENVVDNNLFIDNNVLYAEGASIEVYDMMGRLIAKGDNSVDVSLQYEIMIVKTVYSDNKQFISKLVNMNK